MHALRSMKKLYITSIWIYLGYYFKVSRGTDTFLSVGLQKSRPVKSGVVEGFSGVKISARTYYRAVG